MQSPSLLILVGAALAFSPPLAQAQSAVKVRQAAPRTQKAPRPQTVGAKNVQHVDLRQIGLNAPISLAVDAAASSLPFETEGAFSEDETMLLDRAELAVFMASGDHTSVGGSTWIQDDLANGETRLPASISSNGFGYNVRDAVRADIDHDGRDEIVALVKTASTFQVYRVDVSPSGDTVAWGLLSELSPIISASDIEATLTVGDFDGDKRDEIGVFRSVGAEDWNFKESDYWIFDDPVDGSGVLLQVDIPLSDSFGSHMYNSGVAADLDGDGRDELVVVRQGDAFGGGTVRLSEFYWDETAGLLRNRFYQQLVYVAPPALLPLFFHTKVAAGQFDQDGAEELMLMSSELTSPLASTLSFSMMMLNYNEGTRRFDFVSSSRFSGAHEMVPSARSSFDICAVDRFGNGQDWLATIRKPIGAAASVRCVRPSGTSSGWQSDLVSGTVPTSEDAVSLRAADSDSNGTQELYAGFSWIQSGRCRSWVEVISAGTTPSSYRTGLGGSIPSTGRTRPLIIVPAELDGDGLRVRYVSSSIWVSNPVPLTLIAAVPTKAGIEQNYVASSATVSIAVGSGTETAYSTSTTITGKAGFEFDGLADIFGGSVKATIEDETRTTEALSSLTTVVTGYTAGSEDDVIVFASNDLLVHEYEVVSAQDPMLEGERFTIDVPLETEISKWTVTYFNQSVLPRYRIGSDLLPHTVGSPETYRSFAEMVQETSGVVSWQTPGMISVGQGTGGTTCLSIELASENATTEQTEMAAGVEASFKAFGFTTEGSISASTGAAYTVSTTRESIYQGCIGDISAADFSSWAYSMGVYVYQPNRLAVNNVPTGLWVPGGYPLTVINFWTNAFGAGY